MFTEISIENFKAFGKMQRIPLKPITLLYGPNSLGKSFYYFYYYRCCLC